MDDCLIVGAGVVGLSLAYELAAVGMSVRVIDQGPIGREASWAGAGILPPANLATAVHPLEQLRALSHELHTEWAARLKSETGIDTGYRRCGGIYVARSAGEVASLVGMEQCLREQEIDCRQLSEEELVEREPAFTRIVRSGRVRRALLMPGEAQLRNPMHLQALELACRTRGVSITPNCQAKDFEVRGDRILAVVTATQRLQFDCVCITGGAWSHQLLQRLGVTTGILPVRGQMVLYRCAAPPFRHVLNEGPRYLVARDDGRVLVGSTEEEVGFDKSTTASAIGELQALAEQLIPELKPEKVERTWAGLRPGSFDGFPYLGRLPGIENGYVAAGHYRSGLHMSTGTSVVLRELIRGETPRIDLSPFRPGRG